MNAFAVDKEAVARNFSAAADRYDRGARAQGRIATSLAERIPPSFSPSLAVDLGCGTGFLSSAILSRFPAAELVGIDLAEGMVEACRRRFADAPRASFRCGDAEGEQAAVPGADLVAGSCVAQWFAHPAASLRRWGSSLAPGGILAFALLLAGSFPELSLAWRGAVGTDPREAGLAGPDLGPEAARAAGLRILRCEEERVAVPYGSAREALRSFRGIGASFDGHSGFRPLDPSRLRALLRLYGGDGTATVTHRVQYLVAERPA